MKTAFLTAMMVFGLSATADQVFAPAPIDSAVLDGNMNLTMDIRLSNPCDRIASPQISQDAENPMLLKVEGLARKGTMACIDRTADATQTVNLPALVEVAQISISKSATYVVRFEGFEGEYAVPGSKLMISIQPQPITE